MTTRTYRVQYDRTMPGGAVYDEDESFRGTEDQFFGWLDEPARKPVGQYCRISVTLGSDGRPVDLTNEFGWDDRT